ncbi:TPA: hypothetical protein ACP32N_005115 [Pseudomonas aeruginosa]
MTRGSTLDERIDTHLKALRKIPHGHTTGRFLSFSNVHSNERADAEAGPDHILRILMKDIAGSLGEDILDHLGSVTLEQFALMSALRCEGTGAMMLSLVDSYMSAYANPATTEEAVKALKRLEQLQTVPVPSCN